MERREFIKHTAALASVSAVGGIAEARVATELREAPDATPSGIVLVDDRFSDSRRFAAVFAAAGARLISVEDDIGRVWYGELRERCASGVRIAGLTLHSDLFISEQFARECGKRLRQFGFHDCRGRDTLAHTVPVAALDLRERAEWAEEIANYMLNSGEIVAMCDAAKSTLESQVLRSLDHPGSMYSWMIG